MTHRCHNGKFLLKFARDRDMYRTIWNCLKYVDMNMVRAGAVDHPSQWRWCGYQETVGLRQRYRLIDRGALMIALCDGMTMEGFKDNYSICIEQ